MYTVTWYLLYCQLLLEFPPVSAPPRCWWPPSSSVSHKTCGGSKKTVPNLMSATFPGHETCSVSSLFTCCAVPTLPAEGMSWTWLAVLSTFLAQPRPVLVDGLTHSNAEQAVQQPLGRTLSGKRCQLDKICQNVDLMFDFIATYIWADCYHYHNSVQQRRNMVDMIIDQASSFLRVNGLEEQVFISQVSLC